MQPIGASSSDHGQIDRGGHGGNEPIVLLEPFVLAGAHEAEWGPVPHEVKISRLERLQAVQKKISGEIMSESVGREVEVLVEGPSEESPFLMQGRHRLRPELGEAAVEDALVAATDDAVGVLQERDGELHGERLLVHVRYGHGKR